MMTVFWIKKSLQEEKSFIPACSKLQNTVIQYV